MARLRVLSGAEVCRILAERGFAEVRRRGSHVVMQKREMESTITVPVPMQNGTYIACLLDEILGKLQQFPANPLLSEKQAVRKVLDLMCGEQDPRDMILI